MGFLSTRSPRAEAASPKSDEEAQVPSDASLRISKLEERCTKYEERCTKYEERCTKYEERCAKYEERCAKYEAGIDQLKSIIDRLDKVEAQFAKHSNKEAGIIKDLEQKEDDTARHVEILEAAGGTEADALLMRSKSSYLDETFKDYEISLPESIYSDLLLTWVRGYIWPCITSTSLFLACITVQWVFVIIMSDIAVDQEYGSLESKWHWGENFLNKTDWSMNPNASIGNHTLKEYCHGDTWTWESSALEVYGDYTKVHWLGRLFHASTPSGLVLGVISLLLWAGACTGELRDILEFMSLFSLPWSDTKQSYQFKDGHGQLLSLGWVPRIAMVIIVSCRIAMLYKLGEVGCRFLAYTTELSDFILNAVALSFVLDIDELCFRFLSFNKIRALRTLDPPVMSGRTAKTFHFMSPMAEAASILLILLITFYAYKELLNFALNMVESAIYLCGDELIDGNVTKYVAARVYG